MTETWATATPQSPPSRLPGVVSVRGHDTNHRLARYGLADRFAHEVANTDHAGSRSPRHEDLTAL